MKKFFDLEKLKQHQDTQRQLCFDEVKNSDQDSESIIDIDFPDETLESGHLQEILTWLHEYSDESSTLEDCISFLDQILEGLEQGHADHRADEEVALSYSDEEKLAYDLLDEGFCYWIDGLVSLIENLECAEEGDQLVYDLQPLYEGNRSLAKLALLLHYQESLAKGNST